jgi:hypothetical protein
MKNALHWEIPSSVDVEGFLKKHPPSFRHKLDHFYYIIDYLSRGMLLEDLDDNAGYVNLNAARLQSVNHNYKQYMDHLLKHGLIRTDMKYVVGKKSKGYMINRYNGHRATVRKIEIHDLILYRHRLREMNEQKAMSKATEQQYPHMTKWFDGLVLDREGALAKVEELFPEPTGGIRGTRKYKASNWQKRYRAVQSIDKFTQKEYHFTLDTNVGRFHSNLTNLKKEIRNYLTYKGQRLVNVDIRNSQPLFSTLLLTKQFYQSNILSNYISSPSTPPNITQSYTIMIVKTLDKYHNQDISKYIEYVNSGSFYEHMHEQLYPGMTFNKPKVKTMMFMIFFSSNRYIGQAKAEPKRRFKQVFPYTYEIFRLLKTSDYTALSRILQRIESECIIQNVVPRIAAERPDLPIFTIHDSVVTTVGNEQYVASIIREEIKRLTDLDAKLGIEYWL